MTMTAIDAEAAFREDPAKARSAPTVTATLANGRARLSAGSFNWDADLPPILGGENLAPSPTAYLLGALAGCAVAFLNDTLAPQFEVDITDVTAVARCSSTRAASSSWPGTGTSSTLSGSSCSRWCTWQGDEERRVNRDAGSDRVAVRHGLRPHARLRRIGHARREL